MKKLLLLFAVLFFSVLVFAQRISIQPSVLDFRLSPSGNHSQSVSITNLSEKKISFHAYLADWLRDSTGGHQYFKPDTLSRSCASWVKLNKTFIEVDPGKTAEIIVQLQTPANDPDFMQMKWAMLFLQTADEQEGAAKNNKEVQTQIKELLRVGIHIYQTPPGVNKYAAKALSLKPLAEPNTYEFITQNTGNVMLQCKAYLELTNISDGTVYKLDKTEFPVFPQGLRTINFEIPDKIPQGKYSALAILDIGEEMPLEAIEKVIEIKK